MNIKKKDLRVAVIGLGYVGLPLALEFAKKRKVIKEEYVIPRTQFASYRSVC